MIKILLLVFIFSSFSKDLKFEKKTIVFKNKTKLTVEVAVSNAERSHGLMYRKSMPKDQGMLFIFPEEQLMSFWMKNTYIPLSIGFFDKDKKLFEILDMNVVSGPVNDSQLENYVSSRAGKYALEVNQGWFSKNKIKPGEQFRFLDKGKK